MNIKKKISIGALAISVTLGSLTLDTGCSKKSAPKKSSVAAIEKDSVSLKFNAEKRCGGNKGEKKCGGSKSCGGKKDNGDESQGKLDDSKQAEKVLAPKIEKAEKLATSDKFRSKTPQLLSRIHRNQEPLPFISHDISVVIVNHRVRVVQDMVFKNHTNRTLSGNLMVELPDGASPCYMGMFLGKGLAKGKSFIEPGKDMLNPAVPSVPVLLAQEISLGSSWQMNEQHSIEWGTLRSARVVNPIQGREVYEKITRRRIDPALSEWAGSGKFSTRIFPIPANSYKRIVFAYEQPLNAKGKHLLYALPVPKEIKAQTRITAHLASETLVDTRLLAGADKIIPADSGKKWQLEVTKDFSKSFIFQATPKNPNLQVLVGQDDKIPGKLVHLRYKPHIPIKEKLAHTGKALFIVDTSYSSKDKLAALSGKMLRAILESDTSIDDFAVVSFDVRTRWITNGFLPNTKEERQKALTTVEDIWLEGATNFTSVLQFMAKHRDLQTVNTVFLLSDGQITWGVENPQEFTKKSPKLLSKRWICYSFSDIPSNKNLFQVLSYKKGQMVHVGLGQDLTQAAKAHRLASSSLEAIFTNREEEIVVAGDPKQIYPGQVLQIAIKTVSKEKELELTAIIDEQKQNIKVPLSYNPKTSFLAARAWANLYARRLLDLYDENANKVALALSQRFALSNRQASFIILETDAEYKIHKIANKDLNINKLMEISQRASAGRPFGAPKIADLSPSSLQLISDLETMSQIKVWDVKSSMVIKDRLEHLLKAPMEKRGQNTPAELYLWAKSLADSDKISQALRVLSTIVEVKPQDDQALRLVGYVLMEWSLYQEALELFSRVRQRRPFEPQNYLLEGMVLAAQGQLKEAAIRYEIVLQRRFLRFGRFAKPIAHYLYRDLLKAVVLQNPNFAKHKSIQNFDIDAKGQLLLFWNLDDTDVDLYIQENKNTTVSYNNKNSPSGGKLFWDNTIGLGPELYQHPTLSKDGFEVYVNYFGSRSVAGQAPAATMVVAFTANKTKSRYKVRYYSTVLHKVQKDKVFIMPRWK